MIKNQEGGSRSWNCDYHVITRHYGLMILRRITQMLTKYYDTMLTNTRDLFDPFRMLDDAYFAPLNKRSTLSSAYRVNKTETGLELSIDLPGLKSKDLSVQTSGRDVKISGKIRDEEFKYTYRLAKDYTTDVVDATLEDGVLTLAFQKAQQVSSKTVEVKVK